MTSDFEDLLKLFNANAVRYMIVGGNAVTLYRSASAVPSPSSVRLWRGSAPTISRTKASTINSGCHRIRKTCVRPSY
jgi:hypothetical protein